MIVKLQESSVSAANRRPIWCSKSLFYSHTPVLITVLELYLEMANHFRNGQYLEMADDQIITATEKS